MSRSPSPNLRRVALLALACILVDAGLPALGRPVVAQSGRDYLEIVFLDVGQGDAVVLRAPTGEAAMIDAGRTSPLRDLARLAVDSLVLLVGTNPRDAHIGGVDDVITARPVDLYLDDGLEHESETYATLMATLRRLANIRYAPAEPATYRIGAATLEILPMPDGVPARSVGAVLRFGAFSAFFPGDAGRDELGFWLERGSVPDVTLLKASRHGSATGFTVPFVDATQPEVVVISVAAANPHLDPQPQALTAYGSQADRIVRTDLHGEVTVHAWPDGRTEILTARDPPVHPAILAQAAEAEEDEASVPVTIRVVPGSPDGDETDLNAEHVALENRSDTALDIGRWRVCDLSTRCFRFPDGARIEPRRRVAVYTGYGMTDGVTFFMNNDRPVWNDNGDEARLYDAEGRRVVRHVY